MKASRLHGNTGILAGIVAFAVLVAGALLLRQLYVSPVLERDRAALSKSLHVQQMLSVLGARDEKTRAELATHLATLRDGGAFIALNAKTYMLSASNSNDLIDAANAIEDVLSQGGHSTVAALTGALVAAQQKEWLDLTRKVTWYRYAIGFCALLLLAFVFWQFHRRLKRTKLLWSATLKENRTVLEATKEGLFLLKPSLQVGSVQSGAVKSIFDVSEPISGNFFDFLKRLIDAEDFLNAKDYILRVLEGRVKESLASDLNPLREIEITVENSLGFVSTKFLNFDFVRNELNPHAGLLVSVSDITKEVLLKRELADANRGNDERFSLLMGSIVEDSDEVTAFYKSAHQGLCEINDLLRDDEQEHEDNRQKLESILATVRRLKSDAGVVGVMLIETSAHQFEGKIQQLLDQPQVTGKQILSLTAHLKPMISELAFLEQLNAKLKAQQLESKPKLATVSEMTTDLVESSLANAEMPDLGGAHESSQLPKVAMSELESFAIDVAGRQGKVVRIEKIGFENFQISDAIEAEINALCMQLIRNSVTHGIELPSVRRDLGKPSEGRILISLRKRDDKTVLLKVWDDGRGFDFDAIRRVAVERDLVKPDVVTAMSKGELIRFIFVSGFSTYDAPNADAGQGVGLDLVRDSVVKLDGKISVKSSRGRSSQVTIELPKSALSLELLDSSEQVYSERARA